MEIKSETKNKKPTKKKAIAKKDVKKDKNVVKKITKIKIWMMENGVNQKDLAKKTEISTNTINRLINKGKASKSIIKSVSNELGISFEELNKLLEFNESVTK